VPIYIHLIGNIIVFFFSALFHLCGPYNKKTFKILSKLDYNGIAVTIISSSCAMS